jgi:hypothetical protein
MRPITRCSPRANTDLVTDKIREATNDERLFDVSTDGLAPYERSIERNLFDCANHSQIVKLFSHHVEEGRERYSPAKFAAVAKDSVTGMPDLDRASASHVERKNGTPRPVVQAADAIDLCVLERNGSTCTRRWRYTSRTTSLPIHRSLRVTPAMESGGTDHVWTLRELLQTNVRRYYLVESRTRNASDSMNGPLCRVRSGHFRFGNDIRG